MVKQQGEAIFARLSEEAREQLRRQGRTINEQAVRLERIREAIEHGRSLIVEHNAVTLGDLPEHEQMEFARLWVNATGGEKLHEN